MQRFKNVLVVCDDPDSDEALMQRAALIAQNNDASLCLVSTLSAEEGDLSRRISGLSGAREQDGESELLTFRRSQLQVAADDLRRQGIQVTTAVLQGIPFIEIIKQVYRGGHDLLLKTASGRVDGYHRLFASVDLHLMRKCPCPVWIMQPGKRFAYDRILAAIDPDPDDPERHAISRLIMDLSTSLKRIDEGELHVLHAWRMVGEDDMRASAFTKIPKATIDKLSAEEHKKSKDKLDRLLSSYDDRVSSSEVHLIKGEASEVVSAFAHEQDVDVIVMGTIGRSGVQGFFIGNTAETVLGEVACSVLAVKPPGFVSPVQPS